jgi:chromosome segregation ATPase
MSVQSVSTSNVGTSTPVAMVPQNPAEELSLLSRVSQFFLSWVSLPSISDLLSGNWFTQERLYKMAYTGLLGAACVGALGSLVLLIEGAPAVAGLLGGLSLCSAAGAYMADQAAKQRVLSQCVDDIKKTNDDLKKTNEDLRKETHKFSNENKKLKRYNQNLKGNVAKFSSENKNLKSNVQKISTENKKYVTENKKLQTNVQWMTDENGKLNANVQQLSGEVVSLHQDRVEMKNEHRKIRRKLERQVKQTQANLQVQSNQIGKFEAQNNRYRTLVDECRACIGEVRDSHVVQDQALLQRLNQLDGHMGVSVGLLDKMLKDRQIFCDGYQEQLAALGKEIEKIQDPRYAQAQWNLQNQLQQQIAAMEKRDKQLIAEIGQREGVLQELEKRLHDLRSDLATLLKEQKAHNQIYAGNNKQLTQTTQALGKQIAALDKLGTHYFGGQLQPQGGMIPHQGGGQLLWT